MPVGLLIGASYPKDLQPLEVIPSVNDGPYTVRMNLGWSVVGLISSLSDTVKCNFVRANEPARSCSHVQNLTAVKEMDAVRMLKEMYEIDFNETGSEKKGMSSGALRSSKPHFGQFQMSF